MRTTRRRRLTALIASLALAAPILAVTSPAVAEEVTPADSVRINEVLQDNELADQIELINLGTGEVDVSGWIVKDDDDERVFAIAPDTKIAAGGFQSVVVDDDSDAGFGLGKEDIVRVYLADGVTLVDQFSWSGHQSTSYGRCPDGTGEFIVTPAATPGAANLCSAPATGNIVINEVESSDPGDLPDWVELTNIGVAPVELGGLVIRDSDDTHSHTISAQRLAPGAFLVVDDAALGFGLGGDDAVRLFDADAETVIDEYSWGPHATETYGRCPDGVGDFESTASATPGAANDCTTPELPEIAVNETESNNGEPGDWIELYNHGATAVDLSEWIVRDSDDTHVSVIPAGTEIAAGGFYVVEESALGFGLGKEDSARLYLPGGRTLVDAYAWVAVGDDHAPTTFGRCPDGSGEWKVTTASTKGAANDCGTPIRINEIESNGGTPGDWVELVNIGVETVDVAGFTVVDDSDKGPFALEDGTTIAAGGFLALEVEPVFGLSGADAVSLYDTEQNLLDTHSWTEHAATTYGRCPDGTGEFAPTKQSTKGAANSCEGDIEAGEWPGSATVAVADSANAFGSDMSGLVFDPSDTSATGTLWAVNNGSGSLHRLVESGGLWDNDPASAWGNGKKLLYPDGTGTVDAEGLTITGAGASGGVFVASERNTGTGGGGSRPSVLRYDPSGTGAVLTATAEWNLVDDLPALEANGGLEGIAWVPDSVLVDGGFVDQLTGLAYDPQDYSNHGGGLFVVGVEGSSLVYVYALDQSGSGYHRISTFESGFPGVMELTYDAATEELYVICDEVCDGRTAVFGIAGSGADAGTFTSARVLSRPAGMPNLANEGFAIAPDAQCIAGSKPVVWADDSQTGGHALRAGTIDCTSTGTEPPGDGDGGTLGSTLPITGGGGPAGGVIAVLLLTLGAAALITGRGRSSARKADAAV